MAMEMGKTEKMRKLFADQTLDAEQLENVAGGGPHMTADDSRFLNVLLQGRSGQPNRYGETRAGSMYEADSVRAEVRKGWKACGIRFGRRGSDEENYYEDMNTKQSMTQESAMRLAMQRMGKQLAWSDWYWD